MAGKIIKGLLYEKDIRLCREVERWIENLINANIDIEKTILASQKTCRFKL